MQLSHPLSSSPHAQASLRHLQTGRLVLMLSGGSNAAKARPPVALTRTPFLLREKPSKATAPNFRAVSCAAAGVLCSQRVHRGRRTGLRAERDEAKARFVDWMRETGIVASPKVDIVPDAEGGRRVVCTAPIERGESLVRLPGSEAVSVAIDGDSVPEALAEWEELHMRGGAEALAEWWALHTRSSIRLAVVLASRYDQFEAYIDMLYPLEQICAPWRWEESDLQFLPPKMRRKVLARKAALQKACEDLERLKLGTPKDLFLRAHHAAASRAFAGEGNDSGRTAALAAGAISMAAFGAAAATGFASLDLAAAAGATIAAASGAVIASSKSQVLSLLPMIDLVNHQSGEPPDLQFDPGSRTWELKAKNSYKVGDEIVFSYGDKDSDSLLLQHGFVEEDNKADRLCVELPDAGSYGLSEEAAAQLGLAGLEELCFGRDGSLQVEVPRPALAEGVAAALRHAADGCKESEDDQVAASVSSPNVARVLLRWRQERRKMLAAAARRWKVNDLL
ncbi:unnamed protein product [Effrenium voratum]|uniref:SET domain-containing protein n=1 Tax=Effrenium voratum TaxID=2562239 RepID=A0AA36I683_9DINO|nr:unnamed protein product [Effrenium voratum]CAJ1424306.1 unnamed protein product [Effrenium voratum]